MNADEKAAGQTRAERLAFSRPAPRTAHSRSSLSLRPPLAPMEALPVGEIPRGTEWQYEPKWDGFRCLVFRDRGELALQSKSGQPLTRYFPELVKAFRALAPRVFVLDGEIVVPVGASFSFDALLQRIHPATSRIEKLAQETPALFIAFDLLADQHGNSLLELTLNERRRHLEAFAQSALKNARRVRLSPATTRFSIAQGWLKKVGGELDGIIAKRRDLTYRAGERTGMQKIKNYRSADCVVGGFRYGAGKPVVGSLLLGLYDGRGLLHHVGFTSNIKRSEPAALTERLRALIAPPGFNGNAPGGPSRWATARSTEWEPLKPKLVVEVRYDHFSGGRFRHGVSFMRWRPDKAPRQCTFDQVEQNTGGLTRLLRA